MKKFNIRKVLDGLKEVSSSAPSVQVGPQENHLVQETIQSEHFQLCKVSQPALHPLFLLILSPLLLFLHPPKPIMSPPPTPHFQYLNPSIYAGLVPSQNKCGVSDQRLNRQKHLLAAGLDVHQQHINIRRKYRCI